MVVRTKLVGYDKVKRDFAKYKISADSATNTFLDLISKSAVELLARNTPIDTGELSNSWQEISRDSKSVTIGVRDDQEDKLQYVLFGTGPSEGRYVPALGKRLVREGDIGMHSGAVKNDFMLRVQGQVNILMAQTMQRSLKRAHKWNAAFDSAADKANLSKVAGLTGTRFNKRRGKGRTSFAIRTGRKSLRPRITRKRRVSVVNYVKKSKIG